MVVEIHFWPDKSWTCSKGSFFSLSQFAITLCRMVAGVKFLSGNNPLKVETWRNKRARRGQPGQPAVFVAAGECIEAATPFSARVLCDRNLFIIIFMSENPCSILTMLEGYVAPLEHQNSFMNKNNNLQTFTGALQQLYAKLMTGLPWSDQKPAQRDWSE